MIHYLGLISNVTFLVVVGLIPCVKWSCLAEAGRGGLSADASRGVLAELHLVVVVVSLLGVVPLLRRQLR